LLAKGRRAPLESKKLLTKKESKHSVQEVYLPGARENCKKGKGGHGNLNTKPEEREISIEK